jgi:Ca2+-binding RTX toxin-like protein
MKRITILALAVVTVGLLLAGGAVLAKDIECTGGPCVGTKRADTFTGSGVADQITGRAGNDVIFSGEGDDEVRGGRGADELVDNDPFRDVDTILGGKGNDIIDVREGTAGGDNPDVVDCGPGTDTVFVDPTDTRLNCEILNPQL